MAESSGFTRRHFLTVATAVTGGAGAIATAVPFVSSFKPSARAQALGAPVEADVSKLELGAMLKVEWRGQPIYIVHRYAGDARRRSTERRRAACAIRIPKESEQPAYATNEHRSAQARVSRAGGRLHAPGLRAAAALPAWRRRISVPTWPGGFYCPCHGSKFDLAGRVFEDVPAPSNLRVPPYRYINDSTILIGAGHGELHRWRAPKLTTSTASVAA